MKLSNVFPQQLLLVFKSSLVLSFHYNVDTFRPREYLDFELINGDKSSDLSRNRYDLTNDFGSRSPNLPLLSRGVREIDDLEETFEDSVNEPSCSELRKMWRIARRLHKHAIQTNEIPQKLHPFSSFESDRFRAQRRFRGSKHLNRNRMRSFRTTSAAEADPSKEVASGADYGTIKYAPSDPVKRPRNRVYDVLRELNPGQKYSTGKSPGAWNTGVIEFEPAVEETRPFDKLRNELRKDKNQAPMPDKSVSKSKQIWGKALSHYKSKAGKSKVDLVRKELSDKSRNSRDLSRDLASPGRGDTSYGQRLGRKKSIQERRKSQRKKVRMMMMQRWREAAVIPVTLSNRNPLTSANPPPPPASPPLTQMRSLQRALLTDFRREEGRQDKVHNMHGCALHSNPNFHKVNLVCFASSFHLVTTLITKS